MSAQLIAFPDQLGEERRRIRVTVLDSGWQAEVIGSAREKTATAIGTQQKELRKHLFPRVFRRQASPPGEPAHAEQFGAIEEDIRAPYPGNLIAHHLPIVDQLLLQVERISRVINEMTLPGDAFAVKVFWLNRPRP